MTWSSDWIGTPAGEKNALPDSATWTLEELSAQVQQVYANEWPRGGRRGRGNDHRSLEQEAAERHQAELEEAWQRGYEQGLQQSRQESAEQLRGALAMLGNALESVQSGERLWLEHLQENLCALATAIARHVIGRELKGDAHVIAELTRRALALFPANEPLRVRVNPGDLSTLRLASTEDGASIPVAPGREIQWIADAEIVPGGCMVEGRHRVVDGRVDHALERVYQRLAGA